MSNPYDCFVCHNDGYDHADDCPFNPANMPVEEDLAADRPATNGDAS